MSFLDIAPTPANCQIDTDAVLAIPSVQAFLDDDYALGVRVHSNSWGSTTSVNQYGGFEAALDQYIVDHPVSIHSTFFFRSRSPNQDLLVLFAAGNLGQNGEQTIIPPGVAKNVLTVGAGRNTFEEYEPRLMLLV